MTDQPLLDQFRQFEHARAEYERLGTKIAQLLEAMTVGSCYVMGPTRKGYSRVYTYEQEIEGDRRLGVRQKARLKALLAEVVAAYEQENEACGRAALQDQEDELSLLLDQLEREILGTSATTLQGVVAKLTVAGRYHPCDMVDEPFIGIRSAIADLERIEVEQGSTATEAMLLINKAAQRFINDAPQTEPMSAYRRRWTEACSWLWEAMSLLRPDLAHPDDQQSVERRIAELAAAAHAKATDTSARELLWWALLHAAEGWVHTPDETAISIDVMQGPKGLLVPVLPGDEILPDVSSPLWAAAAEVLREVCQRGHSERRAA